MNNLTRLLPLLAAVLFFSCSKSFIRQSSDTADLEDLEIVDIDYDHLVAKSKFVYIDNNSDIKATANMRLKKDSIIWFSISATLGIEGARGLITRDSIFIIDRVNKVYSAYNYDELSDRYNFTIDFDLIQSALLGNLSQAIKEEDIVVKKVDYYLLQQSRGSVKVDHYVSATNHKIERVNWTDVPTQSTLSIAYSDFQLIGEDPFPFQNQINLSYNPEVGSSTFKTQISIKFNKVDKVDKPLKFPFKVPQRYERK